MWLTMGIWALSNSHVLANLSDTVKARFSATEQRGDTSVQTNVDRPADMQLLKNERFGFVFQGPVGWKIGEQREPDSITLHLQSPEHTATITAVAFDYQTGFSLGKHIDYMEEELQSDLPFVKGVQPTTPMSSLMINDEGAQMVFKDYRGHFEGEKVTARVGYAVKKSRGYTIIGVFADRDLTTRNVVNRSLTSFRLTKP